MSLRQMALGQMALEQKSYDKMPLEQIKNGKLPNSQLAKMSTCQKVNLYITCLADVFVKSTFW